MKTEKNSKSHEAILLAVLVTHIGSHNAISMGALYTAVFGEQWKNLANDTRSIRKIVTEMRNKGVAICSSKKRNTGGYYLASAGSELTDFLRRSETQAIRMLARNARIKKISLPDYMGQLRLELK